MSRRNWRDIRRTEDIQTHMSKEKAASGVVGIRGRLAELVVDPVIARPNEDWVLHGDAVGQHQENAQRKWGLVWSMRP